jgi:hypothetical protein
MIAGIRQTCVRCRAAEPYSGSRSYGKAWGKQDTEPVLSNRTSLRITRCIFRLMQVPPPPLLPLLRSRLQAELLTLVLLSPGREWTLTELASRAGASVATAQREMTRAEHTGVIASRRLGNTRLVTAADSPLTGPLTELLLRSFGPLQVIAEEFANIKRVSAAFLYGAWAARYLGREGPAPDSIDVLIIGSPNGAAIDAAARRASGRLARAVHVAVRSRRWWESADDPMHRDIERQPVVPVIDVTGSRPVNSSDVTQPIRKRAAS